MSATVCTRCDALCCRYFALPIDKPTTPAEFDDVRWFLLHKGVSVFVEDGEWYVSIVARCRHLRADNRCAIYPKRPRICRNYRPDRCDYRDGDYEYEHHFTTVESLEAFARRYLRDKYQKNGRRKKRHLPARRRRRA
jgi:Fe-S-cluster containining protein